MSNLQVCLETHTHSDTCIYIHTHTHTNTFTHVHIYTYTHTCIHTYTHRHIHTHTYTHTFYFNIAGPQTGDLEYIVNKMFSYNSIRKNAHIHTHTLSLSLNFYFNTFQVNFRMVALISSLQVALFNWIFQALFFNWLMSDSILYLVIHNAKGPTRLTIENAARGASLFSSKIMFI